MNILGLVIVISHMVFICWQSDPSKNCVNMQLQDDDLTKWITIQSDEKVRGYWFAAVLFPVFPPSTFNHFQHVQSESDRKMDSGKALD